MNEVEKPLLQTLERHPENWSVRMLIVDMMLDRDDHQAATELLCAAPNPPESEEHLYKLAEVGGEKAIDLVQEYVTKNPANAYGYEAFGHILELAGKTERAEQNFVTASALRASRNPTPVEEKTGTTPPPAESKSRLVESTLELPGHPATPTEQTEKKGTRKATAIIIAVGVHVLIAIIATLIVILPSAKDEPEIVAAVIGPAVKKQEMQKKNVVKQTKKTSAASAAAAPLAQLMRASAVAKIAMPEVMRTSTGPLGIGDADFGGGGFGGDGTGMGDGGTMFGNATSKAMVGTLYDMKKDSKGKGRATGNYYNNIRNAMGKKFSPAALAPYYRAKVKLGFTMLAIPKMNANGGPKAFQAENEIAPKNWFVVYKGKLDVPDEGLWRFHGFFDDMLMVFVNDKVVLDASWEDVARDPKVREASNFPRYVASKPIFSGKWINLKRGAEYTIIVGERPGGIMGGILMIERKGEKYAKRANGSPILPLFSLNAISASDWERIKGTGYQFSRKTPVFLTNRSRF